MGQKRNKRKRLRKRREKASAALDRLRKAIPPPQQAHSTKKGEKGFNRQRDIKQAGYDAAEQRN